MSYFDVFGELGDEPPPPKRTETEKETVNKHGLSTSTSLPTDPVNGNDVLNCEQCGENGDVSDAGGVDDNGAGDNDVSASAQPDSGGGGWRSNDPTPTPQDVGGEDPPAADAPGSLTAAEEAAEKTDVVPVFPTRTDELSRPKLTPDGKSILPRLRLTSVDDNGHTFDVEDDVFLSGGPLEDHPDHDDDEEDASTPDTDITEAAALVLEEPPAEDPPWSSSSLPMRLFRDGWHGLSNLLVSIHHHRRASDGLIETDAKSLNSLSNTSGHSRKSSDTSQISVASVTSSGQGQDSTAEPEEDAWVVWGRIVNEWDLHWKKKQQQVKDLVRKGIPHHFRGIVWQLLCGAHNSPVKAKYAEFIKATSACEKSIRRDIARTYPEHDFFKEKNGMGQESLFNVMKAYSLHDREVGYCQGTAFIVGLLLMQMPEEESFAVLVKLMEDYRMREMFKPSMSELGVCIYQLEVLVQEQLPELHGHFASQSFHTSMYASSWFLTLFTTALPLPLASRVMDWFLSDGMEVIFRLAVAVLTVGKTDILSQDMEGMLKYFQKEMPARFESDPETHFTLAQNVKYNAKRMKKLEKEYTVMKTKEHEEQVELRRLRTENRLLRQQVEYLEAESVALADRLIQGQVCRAEEAEHSYVIRRELEAVRQHSGETAQQLEEARARIHKLSEQMNESSSNEDSLQELSLKTELLQQKEELMRCLQDELVKVRLEHAENEATIRELSARCDQQEKELKALKDQPPEDPVAALQEELAAAKVREAEAVLSLKELQQTVADLNVMWKRHLEEKEKLKQSVEAAGAGGSDTPTLRTPTAARKLLFWTASGEDTSKLQDELMSSRLKEIEAVAEMKQMTNKMMEMETQVQVTTNQLRRQSEEHKKTVERLEMFESENKRQAEEIKDSQRKFSDLQTKMKEELMLARIRDAEHTQCMAELTHKLCNLELKNHELLAEGELNGVGESDRVKELSDKVADLKAEILQLKHSNRSLNNQVQIHQILTPRVSVGSASEEEDLRLRLEEENGAPGRPDSADSGPASAPPAQRLGVVS
ncbi:ecotropic viral integration site 5 ortholog-like isoform X1 [Amphibalanus amphitrite]|uniref:ecotropic viral integration site 5 ortholog-like isoform X1 n=1 Tax=Amphibalanus amphitrite TaxID=1232801 RepID=UPI001C91B5F9|nr:ecotropic viral integration site 5 ortholog-like isoform X1 [Amphibalanus amphitrite]